MSTAHSIASNANTRDGLSIMMAVKAQHHMKREGLNNVLAIIETAKIQRPPPHAGQVNLYA